MQWTRLENIRLFNHSASSTSSKPQSLARQSTSPSLSASYPAPEILTRRSPPSKSHLHNQREGLETWGHPHKNLCRGRCGRSYVFATSRTDATAASRSEIGMGHPAGTTGQSFKRTGAYLRTGWRSAKEEHTRLRTFLAHLDALRTPAPPCLPKDDDVGDGIIERAAYTFLLSEVQRPGAQGTTAVTAPGRRGAVHDVSPAAGQVALRAPMHAHARRLSGAAPPFCARRYCRRGPRELPRLPAPAIDGTGRVR